jgi:hypothetical protein
VELIPQIITQLTGYGCCRRIKDNNKMQVTKVKIIINNTFREQERDSINKHLKKNAFKVADTSQLKYDNSLFDRQ